MKHILPLLIFIVTTFNASAQFSKGDKFVGGSFGLSLNSSGRTGQNSSTEFNINLNPNLGYFINESSAIGLVPQINYYRTTIPVANSGKSSINRLSGGVGVFYRKYFTVADNFYLFLEPKFNYSGSIIEDYDNNYLSLSISPGAAYRISPKWMVEATLGGLLYSRSINQLGTAEETKNSRFAFDFITSNSIGIIYFFKQKAL